MHRMSQRATLPYLSYICLRTLHDSSPKQLSDWSNSWEHSRPSIELNFSAFFTPLSAVPMQEHSKGSYHRQQDDVIIEPILAISHSSKSGRMFRSSTFGVNENRQGVPRSGRLRQLCVIVVLSLIFVRFLPQRSHEVQCRQPIVQGVASQLIFSVERSSGYDFKVADVASLVDLAGQQ
jgi:hypothetical protein